jgi:hypothetical protein
MSRFTSARKSKGTPSWINKPPMKNAHGVHLTERWTNQVCQEELKHSPYWVKEPQERRGGVIPWKANLGKHRQKATTENILELNLR